MIKTALWYTLGWALLIITYPLLLIAWLLEKTGKKEFHDIYVGKVTKAIAKILFYLTGSNVEIIGSENVPKDQAVLFVCNHQGHFDSLIFQGFVPLKKGYVSIITALRFPILGKWMRHMHCVFLDREDARQAAVCISEATDLLKSGHSMVVFPEGRLSDSSITNQFNRGWLRMAVRSKVPIIPVSINGTYKVMTRNGRKIRKAKVKCVISKPVYAAAISKTQENEFVARLKDTIDANVS